MIHKRFVLSEIRRWQVLAGLLLAVALPTAGVAAVNCKSDHVSARAFGAEGSKAWGLTTNDSVAINPFGTVSALDDLGQGKVDIAFSARGAATPLEAELRFTPIAWDAMVLIVHPNNPVSQLSLPQVLDVYAGRARNWSQVGGADKAINLYAVAGPLDGVEYELRRALFGNGALRRNVAGKQSASKSAAPSASRVAQQTRAAAKQAFR